MSVYFVSGTGTNVGKSAATGWLAKKFALEGKSVTTQKLVQTGCAGISEDILAHRKIMGASQTPFDKDFTSCPCVLPYPASPHLAAKLEGAQIDFEAIRNSTRILRKNFEVLLIEGAGGLMVPLAENFLTIDYVAEEGLPLILVADSRLGTINHSLLSLHAAKSRGIEVSKFVFNTFPPEDPLLADDAQKYLRRALKEMYPGAEFLILEKLEF